MNEKPWSKYRAQGWLSVWGLAEYIYCFWSSRTLIETPKLLSFGLLLWHPGQEWFQYLSYKFMSVLVAQSCPTLCDPMDCSPPDSSVHGILQARILEWAAIPFSRRSSWSRDASRVSCTTGRFFIIWATREVILPFNILLIIHRVWSKVSVLDFPAGSVVKSLPASVGDVGLIPGPRRSHVLQGS